MGFDPVTIGYTMMAVSGVSAYSASRQSNKANEQAKENARRRYTLKSGVAENQMEEQQQMALEKMTDVSRAFLVAKGKSQALQAGKSSERVKAVERTKFSEAKGKIAKEIDTNVVNIAQGMLADKIDTEAIIAEANARKKNVLFDTAIGGINGYVQGMQLEQSLDKLDRS